LVRCWSTTSHGAGVDGDGTGAGAASTTTMARGVDGVAGTVRRGRTIVHGRCLMVTVRDTAATGDIVRRTIGHRCRRIGLGTAVPVMVSPVTVRAAQPLGTPAAGQEVRVPELRDIDRGDRMGIALELRRGIVPVVRMEVVRGMEAVQAVVRVWAVRPSRGRVAGRRNRTVRRNRTDQRHSLGLHNPGPRIRADQRRSLGRHRVDRATRVGQLHSRDPRGGRRRGLGRSRTGVRAVSQTNVCRQAFRR
jgi:hypothetical protein